MGLLDGILNNVAGSVLGGGQQQGTNPLDALVNGLGSGSGGQMRGNDLLGAVMSMVQQNGGLPGIVNMLRNSGLGQQADSWVSSGPNAGVSADQMTQVFGGSGLGNLASQLGTYKTDRKVNFDTISDFKLNEDKIHLDNAIFSKLKKAGKLSKWFFSIDKANDKNDYIIYTKKTGVLSYDEDGSGTKKAIEFAKLKPNLDLKYSSFFVI